MTFGWLGAIRHSVLSPGATGGTEVKVIDAAHLGSPECSAVREPVSRFMSSKPITVPPQLDLRTWVDDFVYRYNRKMFLVTSNGHVDGVVSTQLLTRIPRQDWDKHTVAEVMDKDVGAVTVSPDADAMEALAQMHRAGSSRLLVSDQSGLKGVVSLKDLLRFLDLKLELEARE